MRKKCNQHDPGKIETYLAQRRIPVGESVPKIAKERLHLPGPGLATALTRVTDRNLRVPFTKSAAHVRHCRLSGTGTSRSCPVDQSSNPPAAASFAKTPYYFDGGKHCETGVEGGCNAVAFHLRVLGSVGAKYAHKIPGFIVKINHMNC